jgi:hypothetical protein
MPALASHELATAYLTRPERRAAYRFSVLVPGRYAIEGGPEHSCVTENMSSEGASIRGLVIPPLAAEVVCHLRGIGQLTGDCARHTRSGFVLSVQRTSVPVPQLVRMLRAAAERQHSTALLDRRHERVVPRRKDTMMHLSNGSSYEAEIINVSCSGVALATPVRPDVNSIVLVGNTAARIVRHFDAGIGAAFLRTLDATEVTTEIFL